MPALSSVADRIGYLKGLHVQWTTEFEQLVGVHPDRAMHLAEALDDLKTLIDALEIDGQGNRPRISAAAATQLDDPSGLS